MTFIILRLEGPLQSWGEKSFWDERDTSKYPTKSGIAGLLSCCLGYKKKSNEIARLFDSISVSVRVDDGGSIIKDYQTIADTLTSQGNLYKHRVISNRYYLADASFLVAVGLADLSLKDDILNALKNPFWPPYLGRKACIPTSPIFIDCIEGSDILELFQSNRYPIRYYNEPEVLQCFVEGESYQHGEKIRKRDVYISHDQFKLRDVYQLSFDCKTMLKTSIIEEAICTFP